MIRHGKSSWELNVSDKDRPLSQRGIDDAHNMGAFLEDQKCAIDTVFSGPAIRAAHTALIVSREMNLPMHKISFSESLYDFTGVNIPTAGAVLFRFDVSLWSEITKANAEYFFPKTIAKP